MITRVKILMVAIIATLSLASCSEDEPAKMLWEVSATPAENVKAAFDPSFYHQYFHERYPYCYGKRYGGK